MTIDDRFKIGVTYESGQLYPRKHCVTLDHLLPGYFVVVCESEFGTKESRGLTYHNAMRKMDEWCGYWPREVARWPTTTAESEVCK